MAANSSVEPIVVKSTLSPISVASGEPIVINAKVGNFVEFFKYFCDTFIALE